MVSCPALPGNDNFLFAVSARASDDAWAVGSRGDSSIAYHTLAEHWDGTSWSIVPTPDVRGRLDTFFGVDDVSSTDAWAVGLRRPDYADMTLAAHWDGRAWTMVRTPQLEAANVAGVLEIAPSQVWVTGNIYDPAISNFRPLIMRSRGCRSG